jgi:hypothetical protein
LDRKLYNRVRLPQAASQGRLVLRIVNRHPLIVNEDVDYLVEDNAMDDICLSPELDGASGMPHLNITANIDTSEKGDFRKNGPTMNSSWEQNASA